MRLYAPEKTGAVENFWGVVLQKVVKDKVGGRGE